MADKILLADDEEGIRKVLGISLMDSGYEVLMAKNGEEALALFAREHPPIVLTDIKMPGMNGIEVLKQIKAMSPETEVIMITGHGDLDLAIESLQFDAVDFVTKPINGEALEIALKRARERIAMRATLRQYTENLEQLVAEKTRQLLDAERLAAVGQTVAGLSHAIKNITGGLKGGMFVLEKGMTLDNKTYLAQGWEMIKGNVGKINNLALDLLNYARDREPAYELADPNEPVRQIVQLMQPRAEQCGIRLRMELATELPHAWFDPEGMHCCLLNLVTNALDACSDIESGNQPATVVIRSRKDPDWAVCYEVEDNGCGMDEATREKVFKTFFSTKGTKGTGLGLMITGKIVTEHRGEIQVHTEPGRGARFRIRLPKRANMAE